MKVTVNGEEKNLKDSLSLKDLLAWHEVKSQRIAVEINGEIIDRSQFKQICIKENDKIELIEFLGGG